MISEGQCPNVIIAGGGPAGLLTSILLSKIGVASTVVERAVEADPWGSRSYTIVLNDKGKDSLARGGCLESATEVCSVRHYIYLADGKNGDQKAIPKQSPGLGFSRPLLVECLEKIVHELPNVTIRRGTGVSRIITDSDNSGLEVQLEDDTLISATHVIGADGKWSKVRQSFP
jgi:2-polyprenyl-6-methoxyphenol hydroxylase-like FAD-dependent oxidoreductase